MTPVIERVSAHLEPLPTTRELSRHPTRQPHLFLLLLLLRSISYSASASSHGFQPSGANRCHRGVRSRPAAPAVAVPGRQRPGVLWEAYTVHLRRDCRWLFLIEETAHDFPPERARFPAMDAHLHRDGSYPASYSVVATADWASTHNGRETGVLPEYPGTQGDRGSVHVYFSSAPTPHQIPSRVPLPDLPTLLCKHKTNSQRFVRNSACVTPFLTQDTVNFPLREEASKREASVKTNQHASIAF